MAMRFGVLGPLEVSSGETLVEIGGARRHALLAYLLVSAATPTPLDRIVDDLWADAPGSPATVRTYLTHFRRLFEREAAIQLEHRAGGYVLELPPDALDASRFEAAISACVAEPDRMRQLAVARGALSLWRATPLEEFAGQEWADDRARHWTRLHVLAHEKCVGALLETGQASDALSMLEQLVAAYPLHERFWEQLVVARYRCSSQADALAAAREVRRVLAQELGIEPGPALIELERQVLTQDPALNSPDAAGTAGPVYSPVLIVEPLPRGVVTFLLTDIESSTQLWDDRPDDMAKALVRHEGVIQEIVHDYDGRLLKSRGEGDATLSVFERASDGLGAAVALQRRLLREAWPNGLALSTRIALHTGEAQLRDGDYFGGTLNRGARIHSSLAAGGDVLVSRATHDVVADALPDALTLIDLGPRTMKGLRRAETVFAVQAPGLAPASIATGRASLPADRSSLVGRSADIERVQEALVEPGLVTISGPGGIGKTRLLREIHARLREIEPPFARVWSVELVGATGMVGVESALHDAFAVDRDDLVGPTRDAQPPDVASQLASVLGTRRGLLGLDNCEHVAEAVAAVVGSLVEKAPGLSIVATSRQPIGVPGERVIALSPLEVPDPETSVERLDRVESVRLLLDRTRDAGGDLAVTPANAEPLARLCRQLDGIPLAIELAAARLRSTSLDDLGTRLARRLDLVRSNQGDPRHRSLHRAIEWSYQLLDDAEKTLLHRLAIFVSGFALAAAEEVCADDEGGPLGSPDAVYLNLAELVSKSLAVFDRATDRYRLLEPIRFFAREQLDAAGESNTVADRHAAWVLQRSRRLLSPQLGGGASIENDFIAELDNVQAALAWLAETGDDLTYLRIVGVLGYTWFQTDWRRGRVAAEHAIGRMENASPRLRASVLLSRGIIEQRVDYHASAPWLEDARAIYDEIGDRLSLAWATFFLSRARFFDDGEAVVILTLESIALFREFDLPVAEARGLVNLAVQANLRNDLDAAEQHLSEALVIAETTGHTDLRGAILGELGGCASARGEIDRARTLMREAIELQRAANDRWNLAGQLTDAAWIEVEAGDLREAERKLSDSLSTGIEIDDAFQLREAMLVLAVIRLQEGDPAAARRVAAATGWDVEPPDYMLYLERSIVVMALSILSPIFGEYEAEALEGRRRGVMATARAFVESKARG